MNTYTVAAARDDFSRILNLIVATGDPVTVVRYGKPAVDIIPHVKRPTREELEKKLAKYAGMWSGPGYEWAAKIGRPSRYFRKRDYWS